MFTINILVITVRFDINAIRTVHLICVTYVA